MPAVEERASSGGSPFVDNSRARPRSAAARHVLELDGLRGVAILAVMLMHFVSELSPRSSIEGALVKLSIYGVWGVDLFFVLSGFLITGILFDAKPGEHYFRNFYARRTLRIFPLYYLVLLLLFVLLPGGLLTRVDPALLEARRAQAWVWPYLTNIYLASAGRFAIPYISHFWSLAVEEHFYLVWPVVVKATTRTKLMIVCLAVAVAAVALRIVLSFHGTNDVAIFVLTPCRLDTLCIGAWFALMLRGSRADHLVRLTPRLLGLAALAVTGCSLWHTGVGSLDALVLPIRGLALAVLFGLTTFAASTEGGPRWLRAPLRVHWLRFLGKYSYGLYIFHGLIAYWLHSRAWFSSSLEHALGSHALAMTAQVLLGLSASLFVSVLSYECFEVRLLKLKRWFEYRGKEATRAA